MDYRECIDGIIKNNLLKFFNNANEDCSDEFYKDKINNLIMYFENIDKDPKSLYTYNSDIQKRLAKIDEYVYRKPWNKLQKDQKLNRLKLFLNTYLIKDANNTKFIKKKIIDDFNNNKLNSAKVVNYEPFSSKIIGINKLNYNTENNKYVYK